jgi:hypothetical protein
MTGTVQRHSSGNKEEKVLLCGSYGNIDRFLEIL